MRIPARVAAALLALFTASLVPAQTTGSLTGRATDEHGGALPGVTIEVKSTALQGSKTTVTTADGSYRLTFLPPGIYTVSATLEGFARSQKTVTVQLDRAAEADFQLAPTAQASVTVTGEVPIVDTSSTVVGANVNSRQIETLPSGRNYTAIVQIAPGVTTQTSNTETFNNTISVYGSSGLENSYIIDGVDTTGVEYGAQGKELNYEFIQEIDVKTGGYQAEYGRSTGGIINVITKSGGNDFRGDVFGYYTTNGLQADNSHPNDSLFGTSLGYTRYDVGADLGGFILKDRLWFFGAYDRVQNNTTNLLTAGPSEGEKTETRSKRDLGSAKLTWQIAPSHTFVASFFQDPRVDTGAINDGAHTLNGDPLTFLGKQNFGGHDYSGRYSGVLAADWLVTAQFSYHSEKNSVGPSTSEGDTIQYIDTRNNSFQTGGFGLIQDKSFQRYFAGMSVSKFLAGHEIKGGFEYERQNADVIKRESGGQLVTIFDNPNNPAMPVYQHFYWSVPGASVPDNVPISQLNASPHHQMYSAYLQDSWAVLPNLTLNAGIRWDRQQIFDSSGIKQIDLKNDFAPRVGVVWDPTKDHRTKVYGSFGYFYEQIPMDLVIRSYSYEQQPVIYNFDPTATNLDPIAAGIAGDQTAVDNGGGKVLGGFTEPSDPNLKGQYVREFILGAEREVIPNLAVGVKYVYRNYGRVIEDFLCVNDGTYCIGNPGQGIMQSIFSLDYSTTFPAPTPKRIYRGVQLDASKRFSDNWSLLASYLWSKLDGNYDGEFAPYTQPRGTADPNISAAYDYYDFFTKGPVTNGVAYPYTATGPLSNDRRHQVKLSGVYVTPFNLSIGLVTYFRTGTPLTRYGLSNAYNRYEFFLTPRGSEGRVPDDYEADLHLGYPLVVGPVTVNFMVDIFSLLNVQRAVVLDERYNLSEFNNPSYVCGSNADPVDEGKCNSFYLKPISRTPPRQVRFGLRVSF
jgi:outer membrane receptor for ferrienterochelin and colicin